MLFINLIISCPAIVDFNKTVLYNIVNINIYKPDLAVPGSISTGAEIFATSNWVPNIAHSLS